MTDVASGVTTEGAEGAVVHGRSKRGAQNRGRKSGFMQFIE